MNKCLIEGMIYWIDVLPSNTVVSNIIGLEVIVSGRHQPDFNIKSIALVPYK